MKKNGKKIQKKLIYIEKNNKKPLGKENKYINEWIGRQQINYKNKDCLMKNEEIYNLWKEFIKDSKFSKYFLTNEEEWKFNLEKVKQYIDNNKKRPSDKNENKYINEWIIHQIINYKNKDQIMKNDDIQNLWKEFITSKKYSKYFLTNEEKWKENLEKVKKYIEENKKLPLSNDNNKENKYINVWLYHQKENYKNKNCIMKNDEIYNLWKEFINEYSEYFLKN